jgi:hypothetical protein
MLSGVDIVQKIPPAQGGRLEQGKSFEVFAHKGLLRLRSMVPSPQSGTKSGLYLRN